MHFETTVEVSAPAEKVWRAVADVEKWPEWTASTREVSWLTSGELRQGGRARIRQPGQPPLVWEVCELELVHLADGNPGSYHDRCPPGQAGGHR